MVKNKILSCKKIQTSVRSIDEDVSLHDAAVGEIRGYNTNNLGDGSNWQKPRLHYVEGYPNSN